MITTYYKIKHYLSDIKYSLKYFFINVYTYRKELSELRPWNPDFHFLKKHLEILYNSKSKDCEIDISKNKKLTKISRAIYLLNNIIKDDYYELAEKELNLKYTFSNNLDFHDDFTKLDNGNYEFKPNITSQQSENNNLIFHKSREISNNQWNELCYILKGQEVYTLKDDEDYDNWFDGTGYNGWWS